MFLENWRNVQIPAEVLNTNRVALEFWDWISLHASWNKQIAIMIYEKKLIIARNVKNFFVGIYVPVEMNLVKLTNQVAAGEMKLKKMQSQKLWHL